MSFQISLINVLIMLAYAVPGFIIGKMGKANASHLSTASALLVYGCSPCLVVSSLLSIEFSTETLIKMGLFAAAVLVLQVAFILLLWLFFRRRYDDAKYRLLCIAPVLGNVGFFGLPVVKALMPNSPEVACYAAIYAIVMNLIMFTVGVYCLTRDRRFMTPKAAFFNPTMLGFVIGLPLMILGAARYIPEPVMGGIGLMSSMSAPLCMMILGVRLATVSLKRLFMRPFVYLACLGKLVVFPLFCFAAICFLPLDTSFKMSLVILSGTPCASLIFNLSEMYKADPELAANCVLLSTMICFTTLPLLTFLF
ncbi:MAG: AEC family transporter [Clostridia bacterium]|nr:AEC family transporter [Clostridia bacterium]